MKDQEECMFFLPRTVENDKAFKQYVSGMTPLPCYFFKGTNLLTIKQFYLIFFQEAKQEDLCSN